MELAPLGIRVICIEPGFVRTNIAAKASPPPNGDSPYRTLDDVIVAFYQGQVAAGAEPQLAADAIHDAVTRDDGRIHVLLGDDAEFFVSQYRSLTEAQMMSFFEQIIGITAPAAPHATA